MQHRIEKFNSVLGNLCFCVLKSDNLRGQMLQEANRQLSVLASRVSEMIENGGANRQGGQPLTEGELSDGLKTVTRMAGEALEHVRSTSHPDLSAETVSAPTLAGAESSREDTTHSGSPSHANSLEVSVTNGAHLGDSAGSTHSTSSSGAGSPSRDDPNHSGVSNEDGRPEGPSRSGTNTGRPAGQDSNVNASILSGVTKAVEVLREGAPSCAMPRSVIDVPSA